MFLTPWLECPLSRGHSPRSGLDGWLRDAFLVASDLSVLCPLCSVLRIRTGWWVITCLLCRPPWSRRVPNANCCSTQRGHPLKLQQRQQRAGFGSLMQSVTLSLHKCPRFVVWPTRPTFWCSDMPGEQPGAFCDLSRRHDFHVKTQESCREAGERSHCPVLGPDDLSLHFYDLRGFEVPSG